MARETITEQLSVALNTWVSKQPKLVVGIDGYSGAGKTTLLNAIARDNLQILAVHMDDFILPTELREKLIAEASDKAKVFELQWSDYTAIRNLVDTFRSGEHKFTAKLPDGSTKTYDLTKDILALEGVFLFHPKLLDDIWDKRVYLDVDLHVADKQRVAREKAKWGDDYFPESHPDSFYRLFKIAHKRYRENYRPIEKADLVLKV
ncbi:MAG TPA: GTP-binding protein [Candidatus Saccharimonadales bacterium]|jgi:uridine kinase|nr:GTP-binding protein [Candidatus Saccharimonadales bacterium]